MLIVLSEGPYTCAENSGPFFKGVILLLSRHIVSGTLMLT